MVYIAYWGFSDWAVYQPPLLKTRSDVAYNVATEKIYQSLSSEYYRITVAFCQKAAAGIGKD